MNMNRTPAALAVCLLLFQVAALFAQAPDGGKYSAEQFEVRATRGHKAQMRDGVRLSVDVYQPQAEGRFPAILIITPYSNNPGFHGRGSWFARRGYVVAVADARGRYDSEGQWDPFNPQHKTDGYDLVEWLAAQPWCDGKVGMMGLSYMGWTQWWTATQAPPSLKAIVPEVAPPDALVNAPYQNGVLVSLDDGLGASHAGRTGQSARPGRLRRLRRDAGERLHAVAVRQAERAPRALDSPWFEKWIRGNLADRRVLAGHRLPDARVVRQSHGPVARRYRLVRRQLPRLADELPRGEAVRRHARGTTAATGDRPLATRHQPEPEAGLASTTAPTRSSTGTATSAAGSTIT